MRSRARTRVQPWPSDELMRYATAPSAASTAAAAGGADDDDDGNGNGDGRPTLELHNHPGFLVRFGDVMAKPAQWTSSSRVYVGSVRRNHKCAVMAAAATGYMRVGKTHTHWPGALAGTGSCRRECRREIVWAAAEWDAGVEPKV